MPESPNRKNNMPPLNLSVRSTDVRQSKAFNVTGKRTLKISARTTIYVNDDATPEEIAAIVSKYKNHLV